MSRPMTAAQFSWIQNRHAFAHADFGHPEGRMIVACFDDPADRDFIIHAHADVAALLTEAGRLRRGLGALAEHLRTCPPPDVAGGYDLCPCGSGSTWPCAATKAAWFARGFEPEDEASRIMRAVRNEIACSEPYDPAIHGTAEEWV